MSNDAIEEALNEYITPRGVMSTILRPMDKSTNRNYKYKSHVQDEDLITSVKKNSKAYYMSAYECV